MGGEIVPTVMPAAYTVGPSCRGPGTPVGAPLLPADVPADSSNI
ncbi:hypothetical protein ACSNOB_03765 [Micromonospora sp. URMC 106]